MRVSKFCFGVLLTCWLASVFASAHACAQSLQVFDTTLVSRQSNSSLASSQAFGEPPGSYSTSSQTFRADDGNAVASDASLPVTLVNQNDQGSGNSGDLSASYQPQPAYNYSSMYCRPQMTVCEAARQSLFGDVYAAGSWRPLSFEDFFTDGWNEPWAGGPAGGEGLTPRHGWLGANEGVLYRLWLNTFTYASGVPIGHGMQANAYISTFSVFLPLSRRLEVLFNVPEIVSGSTSNSPPTPPTSSTHTNFGDLTITPRFLLHETERVSQVFAMDIQTPTGVPSTLGGQTSLTPRYEFWTNPTGAWVTRGGFGVDIPMNNRSFSTYGTGNLAVGRYLTKHDAMIGDLVLYGATNVTMPFERGGTIVSIGPGTRFHLTNNWFVLAFSNFVVTNPQPYSYQTQVAIMKVF